jgi:hypothetical protein
MKEKGGISLAGRRKILNDFTAAEGKKNSNCWRMF